MRIVEESDPPAARKPNRPTPAPAFNPLDPNHAHRGFGCENAITLSNLRLLSSNSTLACRRRHRSLNTLSDWLIERGDLTCTPSFGRFE